MFLHISFAISNDPMFLFLAKNMIILSVDTCALMFAVTEFWIIRPIKEPIIRCKSSEDKKGENEPTMNFKKFKASRYISEFSPYNRCLNKIDNDSNNSLALS